ncbi:MAG: CopD family protein, partial [Flavobacteriales bacterium]
INHDHMENYPAIIKSLHIIFMVTWFAGLFYMFRLFVYHVEAARDENRDKGRILMDQFRIMERRLWYAITWPSAIFTLTFGIWLLVLHVSLLQQPWMHVKLLFVTLLIIYQLYGQRVYGIIGLNPMSFTSTRMRILNEVPTIILIAVVFLVVMKSEFSWVWGTLSIIGIALVITYAIKLYRDRREKEAQP